MGWLYKRKNNRNTNQIENLEDQKEELLQKIVTLENQFKANEIPEEEYRQKRDKLKEKLKQIYRDIETENSTKDTDF